MPSKTISLLFFFYLLAFSFSSFFRVNSAVTSFFWLKPQTQAVYSFEDALLGFDDHGWARPVRGNYSWLCLEANDTHTVLDVAVSFEVYQKTGWETPGHVTYTGIEFLEKAAKGDLSFIKRIPMDQVMGRIELHNVTTPGQEYYAVSIPSPIHISKKFTVVVDLDTRDMIDEYGEVWGKWILWIDPLKYPLEGRTEEPFVMNWLNTTISLNITYRAPPDSIPKETIFGEIKRYFSAAPRWPIENELLMELGGGTASILPVYYYEPRTGIFLQIGIYDYIDDILTQKFGIVKLEVFTPSFFYLSVIFLYCDLDSNGVVNIVDVTIVAKAFGSKPENERWNPIADINKDGVINIKDLAAVAKAFGTEYITTD